MKQYKEGYVYHIKDDFFEKMDKEIPDNKLMANKENGNYRPTYYCTKDENTGLLWVVPMSTKFDKYQAEYDKQVARFGSCLKIVLGEFDQQKSAFLLQNMFPITEKYLDHVHTRSGKAISVESDIQKKIRTNMKRLKKLTKRGKKVLFTDIYRIEQLMLDELVKEKEKTNKLDAKIVHADERRKPKDSYLESQRATLEAAELMMKHGTPEQKAAAEKLKEETLKNIEKRMKVLRDGH